MAEAEMNRKLLSAAEKIVLQRNVEFIKFLETEDKLRPFQCGHCDQVAIFHVQLKCGHILCQGCFPIFHLKRCPTYGCNENIDNAVFDMDCLNNEISELKVFCKYHKRGCDVVVSLCDLLSHERNCPFLKQKNEEMDELKKCKEEIRSLNRKFAEFQNQFQPLLSLSHGKSLMQNRKMKDTILERKFTEKFEKYIDNKMETLETKMETKLLSKYDNDFKNLQQKLINQMKENSDLIEKTVTDATLTKLRDEVQNLKKELKKDFTTQNEQMKRNLQKTSKAFIEVKCEEIEKRSFNNLVVQCKKYSEEIKQDLSHDFELKLKQNLNNQRTILLNEIKREVEVKGNDLKINTIQEVNNELTRRIQNEKCNLETSLEKKYELDKLKIKDDLKNVLSSEIHCDITLLSKRLDAILPKSFNVHWNIQDFGDQIFSNDPLFLESQVFNVHEIGCQLQFRFNLYPKMCFEIQYEAQPTDTVFPLNGHYRITFILHDQVDNQWHNDFIRIFEPTFCDWRNWTLIRYLPTFITRFLDFITFQFKTQVTKNELYFLYSRWVKNGQIQVNVILENLNHIIDLEPRYYGHLIWKIDHFKDVCESYKYGRQHSWSEAFYSGEKGYRMKGYLFVDGMVNFRLYFLKGPWDKELTMTFNHKTTISLISQKDKSQLEDKSISLESSSSFMDNFDGKFEVADLNNYVKDDSLIVSFKVEAQRFFARIFSQLL